MTSPITRLSHIAIRTPDVGNLRSHYTETVGLVDYATAGEAVFLAAGGGSGAGGPALQLIPATAPGLDHLGFEVSAAREDELLDRLAKEGIEVSSASDPDPGIARTHTVSDVEGNRLELCVLAEDQPAVGRASTPVAPHKVGHVATRTRDAAAVAEFYESALSFKWSDWMGDFFVFLRCNTDHHVVNFVNASRPGELHHMAFELLDGAALLRAADQLASSDVRLVWGPGRHGVGHNMFIYHPDPDGNVVELFCDLDRIANDDLGYFEPRPWHQDNPQRPKRWQPDPSSANLWGPLAPEGFLH